MEKIQNVMFSFFCGLVRILVVPESRTRLALVLWGREAGDAEERELHRVEARRRDGAWILDGRDYGLEAGFGPSFGRCFERGEGLLWLPTDGFAAWSNEDSLVVPGQVLDLLALAASRGIPIQPVLTSSCTYEDGDSGEHLVFYLPAGVGKGFVIRGSCMEYGSGWSCGAKVLEESEIHREMGLLLASAAQNSLRRSECRQDGSLFLDWSLGREEPLPERPEDDAEPPSGEGFDGDASAAEDGGSDEGDGPGPLPGSQGAFEAMRRRVADAIGVDPTRLHLVARAAVPETQIEA